MRPLFYDESPTSARSAIEMLLSPSKINRLALHRIIFLLCAIALHGVLIPTLWLSSDTGQHRTSKQRSGIQTSILAGNQESPAKSAFNIGSKTEEVIDSSESTPPTPDISSLDKSILGTAVENKHYFKSAEVTQRAQVVIDLPGNFSLAGIDDLAQSIQLILHISDTGDVDDVIFSKDDVSRNTRHHVTESFKLLKFRPALIGHIPVASEMQIEILGGTLP